MSRAAFVSLTWRHSRLPCSEPNRAEKERRGVSIPTFCRHPYVEGQDIKPSRWAPVCRPGRRGILIQARGLVLWGISGASLGAWGVKTCSVSFFPEISQPSAPPAFSFLHHLLPFPFRLLGQTLEGPKKQKGTSDPWWWPFACGRPQVTKGKKSGKEDGPKHTLNPQGVCLSFTRFSVFSQCGR